MSATPLVRWLAKQSLEDLLRVKEETRRELAIIRQRVTELEYEGALIERATDPATRRRAASSSRKASS